MNVRLIFTSAIAAFLVAGAAALADPPVIPSDVMTPPPFSPRTASGSMSDNGFTFTTPLELKNLAASDALYLNVACAISTGSETKVVEEQSASMNAIAVRFTSTAQPDGDHGAVVGQPFTTVPIQNGSFVGSVTVNIPRPASPARAPMPARSSRETAPGPRPPSKTRVRAIH